MLDFTKPVQTRSGEPVRILCTDYKHEHFPIVGIRTDADGVERLSTWTAQGDFYHGGIHKDRNLMQVPQRHKHADVIIAWANGAEIEIKIVSDRWVDIEFPRWEEHHHYRVKP